MTTTSTSLCIVGASGRVGSRIVALALDDERFTISSTPTRAGSTRTRALITDASAREITPKTAEKPHDLPACEVVVDFSSPSALSLSIDIATHHRAALLVGTTGLDSAQIDALKKFSTSRAVIVAPNTSMGVCVLADAVARAARLLGPGFECSIVEAHHSRKKDAPSGTALRLRDTIRSAGHAISDEQVIAMRGGDVIGEHTVRFAGHGEYLEFTHRATSRDLFARGALAAAAWLKGRAAGWYTVNDVLGIGA